MGKLADFKIAIAGLGAVGSSVVELIASSKPHLERVTARRWSVIAVAVQRKGVKRMVLEKAGGSIKLLHDPIVLLDYKPDVVVELIGGADGAAYVLAKKALEAGVGFVTANKALIAKHGYELAEISERRGGMLRFEAAVCGAVPVVKAMRESLATNIISSFSGILNGTCNYILARMQGEKEGFEEALQNCQDMGYAEADPAMDVEGHDTAHKLLILSTMAFGVKIGQGNVYVRGIEDISLEDISSAGENGYVIKLLGEALKLASGEIIQRVEPVLLEKGVPIARIPGVENAVIIRGNYSGDIMLQGLGAGGAATASAVSADLAGIALKRSGATFGHSVEVLGDYGGAERAGVFCASWFLRLVVVDKLGFLADLMDILKRKGASVRVIYQKPWDRVAGIKVITHPVSHEVIEAVCEELEQHTGVKGKVSCFRVGLLSEPVRLDV